MQSSCNIKNETHILVCTFILSRASLKISKHPRKTTFGYKQQANFEPFRQFAPEKKKNGHDIFPNGSF